MKAILITGTSSGLGRALFDILYKKPVYLLCVSRRFLAYQKEIAAKRNTLRLITCDLSKPEMLARISLPTEIPFGRINELLFINNAAVVEPLGAIGALNEAKLLESIQVNMTSPIMLVNSLLSIQRKTELKITILNISTGASQRPIVGWAMYCATKSGIGMFFDVLREQAQGNANIEVHSMDPGVLDTKMQRHIRRLTADIFPLKQYFLDLKKHGKLLAPHAVARKILREHIKV